MIVRKVKRDNMDNQPFKSNDRERAGSEKIPLPQNDIDLFTIPEQNIYTIKGTTNTVKNDRRKTAETPLGTVKYTSHSQQKQKRAPSNASEKSDKSANSAKSAYSNTSNNPY